jgi:hypothetical protein
MDTKKIGPIENVVSETENFIRQEYMPTLLIGAGVLIIYESLVLYFMFRGYGTWGMVLFLFPVLVGVILYSYIKAEIRDKFYEQFARAHKFSFEKAGLPMALDGGLFSLGEDRTGFDLVEGQMQGFPLALFNYSFTVRDYASAIQEQQQHTYSNTIVRLEFPKVFPSIYMRVRPGFFSDGELPNLAGNREKLELEGDFNEHFEIYVQKGLEIELYQIFNPEFMARLLDHWKNYTLEFVGKHLYVYSPSVVYTTEDMNKLYALVQYLVQAVGPLNERMGNEVSAFTDLSTK